MNLTSINKLLLLFIFAGILVSCQPDKRLTGVAAGASGLYLVTAYIVAGDTLFSSLPGPTGFKPSINKIGINNFTIVIDVIESDQSVIKTSYWRNSRQYAFSNEVFVSLTNNDYQFSLKTPVPSVYEGRLSRFTKFFCQRTVGRGLVIPPVDSLVNVNQPSSQDIVIIAQSAN